MKWGTAKVARWVAGAAGIAAMAALTVSTTATPADASQVRLCAAKVQTITVKPGISGAELNQKLDLLPPGSTLRLEPGTYNVGQLGVLPCRGYANAPIKLVGADPANPPLIRGSLYLAGPEYWTLSHLRLEGTVPRVPTLQIAGGFGWSVDHIEAFGASATGAYANVVINARDGRGPAGFALTQSCIHGAARTNGPAGYHNIYVNSQGTSSVSGTISRNVIFDNPQGGGIKIGFAGARGAPGAWNVAVERNTIAQGLFGVVLHGVLSGERITGNLMGDFQRSRGSGYRGAKRSGIYSHFVQGQGNAAWDNYFFSTDRVLRRSGRARIGIARSNVIGPAPAFDAQACGGWHPSGSGAGYGAYS